MKKEELSRRQFLSKNAIALSGIALSYAGLPLWAQAKAKNEVIRVGLIGTGSRGTGLIKLIQGIPEMQVVACCDPIAEHLANGIKQAARGAKAYTDYRTLLEDKNIDAVIIATPLYLHYPMAVAALSAGKHIYLEKSMTYDISQAIELEKKVNQSKLVFQVGYQYRYYGLYHKVKEVMTQNWLGNITHFECQYNRNSNWRFPVSDPKMERAINWRMYKAYCGGPLSELCAHAIDAVHYLTDSHPLKVTAMGSVNYWKDGRDTYDNIRAIYQYPKDIKVSVTSVLSNAYNGYGIRILGDKATLEIQRDKAFIYPEVLSNKRGTVDGVTGATIAVTTQGKGNELVFEKPGEKSLEPTVYALKDFVNCILTKSKPASNATTAKDSSIAIHMGNTAAETETMQIWKPEYSS
ncbi:Gfo/Idh/MocA family protein [Pedobacter heparinus]|uniref:Oxidoreductase domain protein n=1 Tax=Pedobacter heparinus (strain ATCC 13125 / DSM 2366 / CIP 104194 / JCM 7457 / NBRC 12017 / NCIMB 9290 / NRRL B-14731 / HIM 762-3) TaxID=485917 RepID=C6Y206_PEDHD|nr:Gfo/Idh/MocA family oxidoreductase [Pedobacter heparinus]ACU02999.1 oxidoreductase domain protein [Pedobacter heparinus DSM 2366]